MLQVLHEAASMDSVTKANSDYPNPHLMLYMSMLQLDSACEATRPAIYNDWTSEALFQLTLTRLNQDSTFVPALQYCAHCDKRGVYDLVLWL